MRSLGSAEAAAGEVATGRLFAGETRDGTEIGLPVAVINGNDEGETAYIQAASDGDELNGVGVVRRLFQELDPAEVAGTILIVGVVNIHAFRAGSHRNPLDDTKLNRAYPGDPDGSSSERIAHSTFAEARDADVVIDLHQGSTSRMIEEVRVRCGRRHRMHDDSLDLARAFDTGHVLDQKGPDGQLARAVADEGVPAIDPELGGCVGWDAASIATGVRGVRRVLQYRGLLDGDPDIAPQTRIAEFEQYTAPAGGLASLDADLGDRVAVGDPLFHLTGVFGQDRGTVTASEPGIFWRTRRLPQVATGEYVCSVGVDVDEV
jgi:predicted deacylase